MAGSWNKRDFPAPVGAVSRILSLFAAFVRLFRFPDYIFNQLSLRDTESIPVFKQIIVNLEIAEPVVTIGLFQQFRYTLPALPGQVRSFNTGKRCASPVCVIINIMGD